MTEFNPLDALEKSARRWGWVALALVLGALFGRGAASLLKPVYEARAELYVNLNEAQFAEDNHLEYVDIRDREAALSPVSGVFYASDVVDVVGLAAQKNGIGLDTENFEYEFFLSRIYTRWLLIVRRNNPDEAAALANFWAEAALAALNEAYPHAVTARSIELELYSINQCFIQTNFAAANACAGTQFKAAADLETYLGDLTGRYKTELDAARNLDHTLDFRLERPASIPLEPVLHHATQLTLAGALIGFILGVFTTASVPAQQKGHDRA